VVITKKDGFLGVDVIKFKGVDIVADARFLPFRNSSFDVHLF